MPTEETKYKSNTASSIFNKDETKKTILENSNIAGEVDDMPVEVSKPKKEQWIKVRGKSLEDLPWKNMVFLKDSDSQQEEPWLLHASGDEMQKLLLTFEGATRPAIIAPYIDQIGAEGVWIVKQASKGMKNSQAHTTGKSAIQHAQTGWRKVYWKPGYGYTCIKPVDPDAIDDQSFNEKVTIADICMKAFEGRIIDSMSHTQVKIWRGQKLA
jgi:hypothetical protein